MNRFRHLVREIHRRSLWQVLGIYVVASWVVLQAVELLAEAAGLPEWFLPFALALLLIGLPIVLATAFVQEGRAPEEGEATTPSRPEGLEHLPVPEAADRAAAEAAGPEERGDLGRFFTWRNAILGGVAAFALWGVIATGWLLLGDVAVEGSPEGRPGTPGITVAVLPLDNLSPDPENAYFAGGVHDVILAELAKIGDLRVISRSSVLRYEDSDKSMPQIGQELGAGAVLEGSVQRSGDRVRITAQLIDTETDEHLWAESYDRELEDIFWVQSDVARQIARALEAELSPEERSRITRVPTDDLEAYELYLRARDAGRGGYGEGTLREAVRLYESAIQRDPDFALAYAGLAVAHGRVYWFGHDPSEGRLARALTAAREALRRDPDLPEAHLAMGRLHYWHRDYDRAQAEYEQAREGLPGDPGLLTSLAALRRRQGRWDAALELFRQAAVLDPLSGPAALEVGVTHWWVGNYKEAARWIDRSLTLNPGAAGYDRAFPALFELAKAGDVDAAWRILASEDARGDPGQIQPWWTWIAVTAGREEEALARLSGSATPLYVGQEEASPRTFLIGWILERTGRGQEAAVYYDSARAMLEDEIGREPDDFRLRLALGQTYAAQGRHDDAIREAERGAGLLPISRDAVTGPHVRYLLARIYAHADAPKAALRELETALEAPSWFSPHLYRVDPWLDPLRGEPGFQELLSRPNARAEPEAGTGSVQY